MEYFKQKQNTKPPLLQQKTIYKEIKAMKDFFIIFSIIIGTAIITATATYNYIILNQEIEKTADGYEVTILDNVYFYE